MFGSNNIFVKTDKSLFAVFMLQEPQDREMRGEFECTPTQTEGITVQV